MAKNKKIMPSILDREISSLDADAFGHRHFSKALESLIEAPKNEPPFSIGLLGKWGTGKSSIKSLYLNSLKDDRSKDKDGKIRTDRFHPITFNAWRFGGDNIKRALLRHVFLALEGDETELKNALFRKIQRQTTEKKEWGDILRDALDKWGWSLLQIIVVYAFIVIVLFSIQSIFTLSDDRVIAVIVGLFSITSVPIIKYLLDPKRFIIPRYTKVNQIELPSTSAEEYEDLLIEQLKEYKAGKTSSKKGKMCERIIVFIDDLDRLSAEEMVSGLDAVRTFMEIPKDQMPEGIGIVFIISCDEERVAGALSNRRHRNNSDLPSTVFNRNDARRFLDRIFQFRLEIPYFPKQDMRSFALNRLTNDLPYIAEDLKNRKISLNVIIDRMIHVNVQSPRNALQLLNTFAQRWWLAIQRERDGSGTERPGGLQEGAVTNHPIAFSVLCTLQVDFPDFYDDLQREPGLINNFTDIFIRDLTLEKHPEHIQNILQKYRSSDKNLKNEYRSLRQYIASLQGLRWPPVLQSLILLSQDPITRKFGDKAPRLFEAFISGDHKGVLTELGRDKDSKPLSPDDVRFLRDIAEELHRETDIRRNNAAAVIAALADRLPQDLAQVLLSPLARRLCDSHDLRWRLGISKISDILPSAEPEDCRVVAGRLIEDLLRSKGEINFFLESGEPPSLDEAIEMTREACALILKVRKEDGLFAQDDETLLDWLETRRVAIGGKEADIPFSELENWMTEYEDNLLPALNSKYTNLLAAKMEADDIEDLKKEDVIRRSRNVFQSMLDAGEESRVDLWAQLNRYVSVKMSEAVALAWEFMSNNHKFADSSVISSFIDKFAERLSKEMEDDKVWQLDWETGSITLLNIIEERQKDIDDKAQKSLVVLAKHWSEVDACAELSTRLIDSLHIISKEDFNEVILEWIGKILTNLPELCVVWLGNKFSEKLNSAQQNSLVSGLVPMYKRDDITEEEAKKYILLINNMSDESIESKAMQGHLQNMFTNIEQRHNNPHDYLFRVFPPMPKLVKKGPSPQTGTMLHNLFAKAKSKPQIFDWLHNEMAGYWPKLQKELKPYEPQNNFNDALDVANQYPQAKGILISMRKMVQKGVVEKANTSQVIEAACKLWPQNRKVSLETILSFEQVPDLQIIANLMDSISPDVEDETNDLLKVWTHIGELLSKDQKISMSKIILSKTPRGTDKEPDLCLRLFIAAQKEDNTDLLRALIVDEELNDDQKKRVWLQIERLRLELGKEFFINNLPEIFSLQDNPETQKTIFETKNQINELASLQSDKYNLGYSLLKSFLSAPSRETKNMLVTWIKEIGAEGALKELNKLGELSEEDVEILINHFPNSRHLKSNLPETN